MKSYLILTGVAFLFLANEISFTSVAGKTPRPPATGTLPGNGTAQHPFLGNLSELNQVTGLEPYESLDI